MFQNILHLILTLLRIQIFFYKNFGNLQSGSKDSVFCKSIHRVEFKDMDFDFPWKRILLLLFLFVFVSCERSKNFGFQNRGDRPPTVEDLEAWKERLAMEEAEIVELEKKISSMAQKTRSAGALSWKIAQGYMKIGDYDMGVKFYNQALKENNEGKKVEIVGAELHFFEPAIPFFEKALLLKPVDQQLLFETALAYANASKDRGWETVRRQIAIDLFTHLTIQDPRDSRFPFQLALIYFDSSMSDSSWEGVSAGFHDQDKALRILDDIIKKEYKNVPARFAKANFLYRLGRTEDSKEEYLKVKKTIEELNDAGLVRGGLEKNDSYQNVLQNLKKIEESSLKAE
ncbi:hypothetical protein IQB76_03955 [Leptospira borgpetersenii serovar Hardjo-bovis]|uniref:Tetratricopeptide repeat protein n=2 Tax=Leptospira borgpetersenii TaxID=174 RepID=M6BPY8_LEPBO|nr:hypothetical protein [Leptospira borgpetersenii]EMO62422.1 tetratricopeptide repeat protein [Leptospira borgpetersenii serovar Pomona str. 200901868]ABJ80088.1 Hypothetical protein LBL_2747 [Leptospira borgpetersenii serovar Hardjo-bovis str. L550]AMX59532.1 hypothetical protein LBK6_14755 [Leptospira borgpetersenii serovar Hardjo]AMX62760.1 hypothetical protein LBK9_14675 [Leptospira borgpetersenii serovar Hardjo]AMX66003.1 hypothetical protein LBK30_14685 [Leptospira borgpetersenii serova